MSKYQALWEYVREKECKSLKLTFDEIADIVGIPLDHSFLNYKKELTEYGWQVGKISMKEQCGMAGLISRPEMACCFHILSAFINDPFS